MRAGISVSILCVGIFAISFLSFVPGTDATTTGYTYLENQSCYGAVAYESDHIRLPGTASPLMEKDGNYMVMSSTPNSNDYIETWDFTGTSTNIYGGAISRLPTSDANNTVVKLDVVMITQYRMGPGHFAISWDQPSYSIASAPQTFGNWSVSGNTTDYNYWDARTTTTDFGDVERDGFTWTWNVWDTTNGTTYGVHQPMVSELLSSHLLKVIWYFEDCANNTYFDYLGITYTYYTGPYVPISVPDYDVPFLTFSSVVNALIWIVIIFLPGLLLGVFAPGIGFQGGLAIMLIVITAIDLNFLVVSVIGLVGVSLSFFRRN